MQLLLAVFVMLKQTAFAFTPAPHMENNHFFDEEHFQLDY